MFNFLKTLFKRNPNHDIIEIIEGIDVEKYYTTNDPVRAQQIVASMAFKGVPAMASEVQPGLWRIGRL